MIQVDVAKLVFPKVSEYGLKVLEILSREDDFSMDELLKPLTMDPVLSAVLLKYANSPLYRRQSEVSNLRTAVSVLGVKNVKLAITVAAMRSVIRRHTDATRAILEHSLAISALAKLIALKHPDLRRQAEDAELLGLIHDFSSLVLAANFPEQYLHAFAEARAVWRDLDEVQSEHFAIDRVEMMRWFAESMRLPEVSREALSLLFGIQGDEPPFQPALQLMQVLALAHHIDALVRGDQLLIRQQMPQEMSLLVTSVGLDEDVLNDIKGRYSEMLALGFAL